MIEGQIDLGLKAVGAGLAMIGALGPGIGIGLLVQGCGAFGERNVVFGRWSNNASPIPIRSFPSEP